MFLLLHFRMEGERPRSCLRKLGLLLTSTTSPNFTSLMDTYGRDRGSCRSEDIWLSVLSSSYAINLSPLLRALALKLGADPKLGKMSDMSRSLVASVGLKRFGRGGAFPGAEGK